MEKGLSQEKLIDQGSGVTLAFFRSKLYTISCPDFIESHLSGDLGSNQSQILLNKNFLKSKLSNFQLEGLVFHGCDFLDSLLDECAFIDCDLTFQHFTSCRLTNTTFKNCKLAETNHQSSSFENCIFEGCEFTDILMKSCTFINCKFLNCQTSNKLFESCLLINCYFENIELQIQTIYENFGISVNQLNNVILRNKRKREDYREYKTIDLDESLLPDADLLSKFTYSYFICGVNKASLTYLFESLENPSWLGAGASSSSIIKLEKLSTLLIYLYESNEIFLLPLVKLNDLMSSTILVVDKMDTFEARDVSRSLHGIKYDLSKCLSLFIKKVSDISGAVVSGVITLEAIGPLEKSYYQSYFDHLGDEVEVISVTPKNSPNFLRLAVKSSATWALVSLILTTQYKYQIEEINVDNLIQPATYGSDQAPTIKAPKNIQILKNYSIALGPLGTEDEDIGFQMISVFSNGMTERLQLSISAKRAIELHKLIIGFVSAE